LALLDEAVIVLDTSSVCEIRRLVPQADRKKVFAALDALVAAGRLCFPRQVFDELDRYVDQSRPDPQHQWVSKNKTTATRNPNVLTVKQVLGEVPEVCDPDKVGGVEEADPYVLAIACEIRDGGAVCLVLTEERRDSDDKMSMTTACQLLGLTCLPLAMFLKRAGIWVRV
jgi:hypothetical protein